MLVQVLRRGKKTKDAGGPPLRLIPSFPDPDPLPSLRQDTQVQHLSAAFPFLRPLVTVPLRLIVWL